MALSLYASSKNKEPILGVFSRFVDEYRQTLPEQKVQILEVGSGTGEHAAYFSQHISNIIIQPTEPQIEMHASIIAWTEDSFEIIQSKNSNILPPLQIDAQQFEDDSILSPIMRGGNVDFVLCINMIHISPIQSTYGLFKLSQICLRQNGIVFLYGPYRVNNFMVESNVAFDQSLKSRNSEWGK